MREIGRSLCWVNIVIASENSPWAISTVEVMAMQVRLADDVVQAREELEAEGIEVLSEVEWLRDIPGFEDVVDYGWFTFRGPDGHVYNCTQGSRVIPEPVERSSA